MTFDLSSFSAFGALLAVVTATITSLVVLAVSRRTAAAEWRANAEAHEQRVKVLEAQVNQAQREIFDQSVLLADLKRNNVNVGLKNLDLQRQVDVLTRHNKQLVAALTRAGIPIPEGEEQPEPW